MCGVPEQLSIVNAKDLRMQVCEVHAGKDAACLVPTNHHAQLIGKHKHSVAPLLLCLSALNYFLVTT